MSLLHLVDTYIAQGEIVKAMEECFNNRHYNFGFIIGGMYNNHDRSKCPVFNSIYNKLSDSVNGHMRLKLVCNWCDSPDIRNWWNKMSKGDYKWNKIQLVLEEPIDYFVVINKPFDMNMYIDKSRTILFHMEPNMKQNKHIWGEWADPSPESLYYCGTHDKTFNNNEWNISKTYNQLSTETIIKNKDFDNTISSVLSEKYNDIGHITRIDFAKFLEQNNVQIDVFGSNHFNWKNYKGSLPYHQKDNAMLPYKYVFNVENQPIKNYYTEKIIDGILAECLVFYYGCPNISEYIDERSYVQLDMNDFSKSLQIIQDAMAGNLWEERLPYILKSKYNILNKSQFFPRIEEILTNHT